jgi:glucosamine-6-phosphate deaminase
MDVRIFATKEALGAASAAMAAEAIRGAIRARGAAGLILATGASQFETLAGLVRAEGVDWSRVTMFHLDEYVGMPATHPASFRRYLRERFVEKVGPLAAVHWVEGDGPDPAAECRRLGAILAAHAIDLALVGIGENGHLAFNDPPADFDTEAPYLVVDLDEACRRQQWGEGWFAALADVPTRAISMSIRQILKSRRILCGVPDLRKARAVKAAVEGPVTNRCPSSILRRHPDCTLLADEASASLLAKRPGKGG